MKRRDFLKSSTSAVAVAACGGVLADPAAPAPALIDRTPIFTGAQADWIFWSGKLADPMKSYCAKEVIPQTFVRAFPDEKRSLGWLFKEQS